MCTDVPVENFVSLLNEVSIQAFSRYVTPKTLPLIREVQEARETRKIAFAEFYGTLMAEFDKDRDTWLKAVRSVPRLSFSYRLHNRLRGRSMQYLRRDRLPVVACEIVRRHGRAQSSP